MHDVDRIAATIRREYASLVGSGAYKGLFRFYEAGTDIVPTPDGPPVAVDVAPGSFVFRDDPTTILTPKDFAAVCVLLTPAPAQGSGSEPQAEAETEEERDTPPEEAQTPSERPQTFKSGPMDPVAKARARAHAQANRHG